VFGGLVSTGGSRIRFVGAGAGRAVFVVSVVAAVGGESDADDAADVPVVNFVSVSEVDTPLPHELSINMTSKAPVTGIVSFLNLIEYFFKAITS
jgi:hypothetical protein